MKNKTLLRAQNPRNSGFTLLEVLVSLSLVAVLVTAFLAVFGPSTSQLRRANSLQEANHLVGALEQTLNTLSTNERNNSSYDTAFDKAYDWISTSTSDNPIILFNYRANLSQNRNGILAPYTESGGQAGKDYTIQTAVLRISKDSSKLNEYLEAADGGAFIVALPQLILNTTGLTVNKQEATPQNNSGYLAFQARFYRLPTISYSYIQNLGSQTQDFEKTFGKPVLIHNMAVRR